MKEEDKKEASTASEAEKPSNEASSASIKTEAMEAEDAGEKSKSEAEAKSKSEASASASTSAASDGKIKAEAKSVLPSGEAGDGDMDEAAMRRALQVRQFGISVWNSGKLKTLNLGKISSNWKKFCNECWMKTNFRELL